VKIGANGPDARITVDLHGSASELQRSMSVHMKVSAADGARFQCMHMLDMWLIHPAADG